MINRFQNIVEKLEQGSCLELVNEDFSNETILNQSVQSSILGDITFLKVDFRNVDFIDKFYSNLYNLNVVEL